MRYLDWYFSDDRWTAVNLKRGDVVHFTRSERGVLDALLGAKGRVVTRSQLLDTLAGVGSESSDRSIDFVINRLRRKLGDSARTPRYIQGRYGEGYIWIVAASPRSSAHYAPLAPVRARLRGDRIMSYCDRPAADRAILERHADAVLVLRLQGFLVTEGAEEILEEIRQAAANGLRHLVIDFRDVQGIDESAIAIFARVHRLARKEGFVPLFSSVRASLEQPLRAAGIRMFESLDLALEWREDDILGRAEHASLWQPTEYRLCRMLADESGTSQAATILAHVETVDVPPRSVIIHAGSETRDMYLLESGTVEVLLEIDGEWVRVSRIWPATLFGEIGFYRGGPRTATIMAVEPCRLVRISPDSVALLEATDPHAAIALHRFVAHRVAARLTFYNSVVIDFFRSTRS